MRILLSDGSGLTARQVATILGRRGDRVEAISSDPFALTRFTRHVQRLHRLSPFAPDPLDWFESVERLLRRSRFDVLFPTQEQVAVLALRAQRLRSMGVATAVPPFSILRRVQDKLSAVLTLDQLGLAQPPSMVARDRAEALAYDGPMPVFLKAPIGTAFTAVRRTSDLRELRAALDDLDMAGAFEQGGLLLQTAVSGRLAMVQAVFQRGRLVASHANVRTLEGAAGGAAVKESIEHDRIRRDLVSLGAGLRWHGALSVDAILTTAGPRYIDVNPRIVEPMNALASGVDLVGALLDVALEREAPTQVPGRAGVRTHQALLALLGAAATGGRRDVLRSIADIVGHRRAFDSSVEELTPIARDARAAIPVAIIGAAVLAHPSAWRWFSGGAVSRYALTSDGWRSLIEEADRGSG